MKIKLSHKVFALIIAFAALTKANASDQKSIRKSIESNSNNGILTPRERQEMLHNIFVKLRRDYQLGKISRRKVWDRLAELHMRGSQMSELDRIILLQMQSSLLYENGYPITAAIYASQSIRLATNPTDKSLSPSWSMLRQVSKNYPIQNLLEAVAEKVELKGTVAPSFSSDWYYFVANAKARTGEIEKAVVLYDKIQKNDRYYFSAKYQQAMIFVDQNKLKNAEESLRSIVQSAEEKSSHLSETTRRNLLDYARLALGRIYYERERFSDAIRMYRSVSRDGPSFYDALFEQSWSFFMGGYPMHALGALYAVESPFFDKVFNPEAPLVRALIYYWLCRYEDSRSGLADFAEKYADSVEKLGDVLDNKRLDSDWSYRLFENMVSGVSTKSLGIPESILKTAAEKDSMLLVRDQYAAVLEEKNRLEKVGLFGSSKGSQKPLEYMARWSEALRKDIGQKFLIELTDMKKDFERLYAQAEFLYVELLMSEKEQILGKELHASSKITRVAKRMKVSGWAGKTQAWKDSKIGEYWWDEMGYYIKAVDTQCQVSDRD